MINDFIKNIQNSKHDSAQAFQDIITDLMVRNKKGEEKCKDLDEFDSESNMPGVLIPGNIYIFTYNAHSPVIYEVAGENPIEFYDSVPLVLITSNTKTAVRGINLNLCNYGLKTLILNIFYNLDPSFFEGDAQKLATKKQAVLSQKILTFLAKGNAEATLNAYLKKMYNINSYDMIFRNYNVSNIKKIRMIEPWQWKILPNLDYAGNIKKEVLDKIHKITGIAKIKI